MSDAQRVHIADVVRQLRRDRGLTLAELGRTLGLSTSRLSEIERGQGSFTAEHLLIILKTFNVGVGHFLRHSADTQQASLQNALVAAGAVHLSTNTDAVILPEHEHPMNAIIAVLTRHTAPRFITALPPVIVRSVSVVAFPAVQHALATAGAPNRWPWLLDHTIEALRRTASPASSTAWRRDSKRACTLASHFLDTLKHAQRDAGPPPHADVIDPDLRSDVGVAAALRQAGPIDRRWSIVSRIHPDDFLAPLESLRDAS